MKSIEELYHLWVELNPMKPEYRKRLDEKFMLDFNYNSNHIEGNTLTYGQTMLLLIFGKTTGDATLRDYEEMKAHNAGLELVKREALDRERPLTESFIRELNRIILVENFRKQRDNGEGTYEVNVGVYKTRPNSVITPTGEIFHYAAPEETPAMMTHLIEWYNNEEKKATLSPIELAALLHYRYIRIHPFEDGNGRIARLLVNYVLLRHGYPMIIVKTIDKKQYLQILNLCDVVVGLTPSDGANARLKDIQPFVEYMKNLAIFALETGIRAAKGESIDEKDDWKKRISLKIKEAKDVPLYSAKLAKQVNDDFFIPLIRRIDQELSDVYTLFDEVVHLCNGKIVQVSSIDLQNLRTKKSNVVSFFFQKELTTHLAKIVFDVIISYENNHWSIAVQFGSKTDQQTSFKFQYGDTNNEVVLTDIISFIGNHLADFTYNQLN